MFASAVTDDVKVGTSTVKIRKLSWRSLEKAQEDRILQQARKAQAIGAEVVRLWRENPAPAEVPAKVDTPATESPEQRQERLDRQIARTREERYASYDQGHVLSAGIVAIIDENHTVTDLEKAIGDLDKFAAEQLYRAILDLSLPPITEEEAEAASKNS